MFYLGCTQQHLKKRTQGHNNGVRKLLKNGESYDTFAKHFASLVPLDSQAPTPTATQLREELCPYKMEIIWQGNPDSTAKTFGSRSCLLCSQERLAITKASKSKNRKLLINSNNEIFGGACRHKPTFHRYSKSTRDNDDSSREERVASATSFTFDEQLTCGSCNPSTTPVVDGDPSTNGVAAGVQLATSGKACGSQTNTRARAGEDNKEVKSPLCVYFR